MSLGTVGQRCVSEREPELGLGLVTRVDRSRIEIRFPASGEQRLYALGTSVLKRVQFQIGETVTLRAGGSLTIESVQTRDDGLLEYTGSGRTVREDALSDVTRITLPQERLMAGQADPSEVFDLRLRTLQAQSRFRQSDVRGYLGGRLELIPHQFYLLDQVARRQIPRVLLADEVGLGKTIEACLILQRLLITGQARRVLVLVPESLTHQWFVELLRRFNLWFSLYDEARCAACEESDPGQNPFLATQLAICSTSFLAAEPPVAPADAAPAGAAPEAADEEPDEDAPNPTNAPDSARRGAQAVEAGWDVVVVDEAHHLEWSETHASAAYRLVESLARRCPGLLLLTATPTQLGLEGHFARLRLLDPARYDHLSRFRQEAKEFGRVAEISERIIEAQPLSERDLHTLQRIFNRDPARLASLLDAFGRQEPGAREALLRTLLDQHGTGRVVFRSTRAAMTGFPRRSLLPVVLPSPSPALLARVARETLAEETGVEGTVRHAFREDPRVSWLVELMQQLAPAKLLLICRSPARWWRWRPHSRSAPTPASACSMKTRPRAARPPGRLVRRTRRRAIAALFEIGSEGRNFQFAHHLVLFDLPLNPGLIEQRIGRLDRIGQTEVIRIHIPVIASSAEALVLDWYHRGLQAFEAPLQGGSEYLDPFRPRLLKALASSAVAAGRVPDDWEELIAETAAFRRKLAVKLRKGRDRLLELNSYDATAAARIVDKIRAVDADPFLRTFLPELLDHFGVRIKEHEEGDVFLDPSHAFIEGFPSLPRDGMLATFDRRRALVREDIRFLSPDHPLVRDAMELLVDSQSGTTAFAHLPSTTPNLLLEVVFVLETVADTRWHVDQFLAPTPLRVLVDLRGQDHTAARTAAQISADVEEGNLTRFLAKPGFTAGLLKTMLADAEARAKTLAHTVLTHAETRAEQSLGHEVQRLTDLRSVNDHVRPEEIALAQEQRERTLEAIRAARLRLDSLRLILEGPLGPRT
jgi:ATP-dependent helicase HepA